MTSLRLASAELRRVTAGRLPRLVVVALLVVPALFAGVYLYANHDPYANLRNVPAALVVDDVAVRDAGGQDVTAGQDVAEELVSSRSFDWQVTSGEAAAAGVADGRFDFALTIPRDFSAALTSSATFDPEQAQLRMTTNDASSYLSSTIAARVTDNVRDALAARVGTEAANNFLLGISKTRAGLVEATKGATGLLADVEKAKTGSDKLAESADTLATNADELGESLAEITKATDVLPDALEDLATGAREVADAQKEAAGIGTRVSGLVADGSQAYAALRKDLKDRLVATGLNDVQIAAVLEAYDATEDEIAGVNKRIQEATGELGELATGAGKVATESEKLAADVPELLEGVDAARKDSKKVADGAETLSDGAGQLDRGLGTVTESGTALRDRLQEGADRIPVMDAKSREKIAQTIGNPVSVQPVSASHASTYGEGLAPFFLPLAAWIGGYVLFLLLRPLSARAMAANQGSFRVALGGFLPAALIGAGQMAILSVAVLFAIGVRPVHVAGTFGFLLLTSATFVAIVHCLNAWFGRTGQLLGLALLVLQLVTAGGTFPWQTIPDSMHWLHAALPMSYAVDGLRQLMYGGLGSRAGVAAIALASYLLLALLMTGLAARRQRVWSVRRLRLALAA